jgi:hypothetical protein
VSVHEQIESGESVVMHCCAAPDSQELADVDR